MATKREFKAVNNFFRNTNPGDSTWQLGVTAPSVVLPTASAVAFINPGDKDINLPLALGSNTFTVVGDSVTTASPFGLSLFYNDHTIPDVDVYNTDRKSIV